MTPTTPMCKIAPNHIGMLRFMGGFLLLCGFVSLLSGKTYYRRTIIREQEPTAFWIAVAAYFFLGFLLLLGTYLCPIV